MAQEIAEAPATAHHDPDIRDLFLASSSAFSSAAPEMMAVPCWSSCMIGMFSSFQTLFNREAFRRFDVFEVDATKGRCNGLYRLNKTVDVGLR